MKKLNCVKQGIGQKTTFMVFMFLLTGCLSYNQKIMMKRDRFGESPVVDMRNGQSALEHVAQDDEVEAKKKKKLEKQAALP